MTEKRSTKPLVGGVIVASVFLLATCDSGTEPDVPKPASVEATQGANATVAVATDVSLAARVKDSAGDGVSGVVVRWSIASGGGSLNATSGTTDETGVARVAWTVGTTAGAGEVRASVAGVSTSASFPVTLTPGPAAAVVLSADTAVFTAVGDTATYAATAVDAYGNEAAETLAWAADDDAVASVSNAGLVTALGPGEAFVTATGGAALDTLVVVVAQEVAAVTVSPTADTLASGATRALGAEAADANGHAITDAVFAWTSSDTAVAAVDTAGVVEGRLAGTAFIVATSGTVRDSVAVTVRAGAVASVSVSPATIEFGALGDTRQLSATARDSRGNAIPDSDVAWSSADTSVVKVDASGLAEAVGNGGAQLVGSVGGVEGTAAVTVRQMATQVSLSPGLVALTAAGDTVRLQASATDANAYAVAGLVGWTSLDPTIATVSNGLVQAVADGTAEVVAALDGAADTVTVSVLTGAGVARSWTGVGGADWATPLSWTPAGRPNAADTARVLADMVTSPMLNGDAAVGSVEVDSGAVLGLGGHMLEVHRDILVAGSVEAGTGMFVHSGKGGISGHLPLLVVTGTIEVAKPTTLDGGLRLLGGTLRITGEPVTIRN